MEELHGTDRRNRVLNKLWRLLPGLLLFVIIVFVIVLGVRIGDEKARLEAQKLAEIRKNVPPVNVVVLKAVPMPIRDMLNLPAQVEPWVSLNVVAEVPGKVVELLAREGQMVEKGDVIVRIDARDYQNNLSAAKASYELAIKNLERTENLYREAIIPSTELDNARAVVDQLRAAMDNADLALERTEITAPIRAVVNRLDVEEGSYAKALDPVASLLDTERLKVVVGIPESDVAGVRTIGSFNVTIDALGGRVFKASKYFLSSAPENLARLYRLELELTGHGGQVLPGMFARVDVVKKTVKDSLSVPLYAIISQGEERFVYVEKDGRAELRRVETGVLEGWRMEITKGINPGENVIVVGHRSVSDGQEVSVIRQVTDPAELFE